jgi:hypothetical protein
MREIKFTPLDQEIREVIPTINASFHVGVTPKCMRDWASKGTGPIKPLRYQRKLMWRVSDIRRLVAGE